MITQRNFATTFVGQLDFHYRGCPKGTYASCGDDIFLTKHLYRNKEYFCVSHNDKLLSSYEDLESAEKAFKNEI